MFAMMQTELTSLPSQQVALSLLILVIEPLYCKGTDSCAYLKQSDVGPSPPFLSPKYLAPSMILFHTAKLPLERAAIAAVCLRSDGELALPLPQVLLFPFSGDCRCLGSSRLLCSLCYGRLYYHAMLHYDPR